MAKTEFDESIYFLKRFLCGPAQVASVWPSSRFLTTEMFSGLELADGDVVIEFGPGTGSFTRQIQALVDLGAGVRYLGIEKDRGMYRFLRSEYPDLEFVLGNALDVADHMFDHRLPPARAIISGLPLILFDEALMRGIVENARSCLRPAGIFRTFSYLHSYPSRGAAELRTAMARVFENFMISRPVMRNMPPAVTLTGRVPAVQPAQMVPGVLLPGPRAQTEPDILSHIRNQREASWLPNPTSK